MIEILDDGWVRINCGGAIGFRYLFEPTDWKRYLDDGVIDNLDYVEILNKLKESKQTCLKDR